MADPLAALLTAHPGPAAPPLVALDLTALEVTLRAVAAQLARASCERADAAARLAAAEEALVAERAARQAAAEDAAARSEAARADAEAAVEVRIQTALSAMASAQDARLREVEAARREEMAGQAALIAALQLQLADSLAASETKTAIKQAETKTAATPAPLTPSRPTPQIDMDRVTHQITSHVSADMDHRRLKDLVGEGTAVLSQAETTRRALAERVATVEEELGATLDEMRGAAPSQYGSALSDFDGSVYLSRLLKVSATLRDTFAPDLAKYGVLVAAVERTIDLCHAAHQAAVQSEHEHRVRYSDKNVRMVSASSLDLTGLSQLVDDLDADALERSAFLSRCDNISARLNATLVMFQETATNSLTRKCIAEAREMARAVEGKVGQVAAAAAAAAATTAEAARKRVEQRPSSSSPPSRAANSECVAATDAVVVDEVKTEASASRRDPVASAASDAEPRPAPHRSTRRRKSSNVVPPRMQSMTAEQQRDIEVHVTGHIKELLANLEAQVHETQESVAEAVNAVRTSGHKQHAEHIRGIFARIGNMEVKHEIMDNAIEATRFTVANMKLWKQDMMDELTKVRNAIPEPPLPYDDSEIREKLAKLAGDTTAAMIQRLSGGNHRNYEGQVKAALEEQGQAIAHLLATKADASMVKEGLASKSDRSLEEAIREFMRQVTESIDDRDARMSKMSASERAQMETRLLRMVTSSLRRIRRQQAMLSKALPQGFGGPSIAGVVYKCLACDQSQAPRSISDSRTMLASYLGETADAAAGMAHEKNNSPGGRPCTAPHEHQHMGGTSRKHQLTVNFSDPGAQARRHIHTHSPYRVKGAGFRVSNNNSPGLGGSM